MRSDLFDPIPYLRGVDMTKAELGSVFGETPAELDRWVRRGCPCKRTGGVRSPLVFDSAQVAAWACIQEAARRSEVTARMVRLTYERDALEAELHRRRGT